MDGRTKCNTCRVRKYRQDHSHKYAYDTLRNNAKRRNVVFTITLEYFIEFCNATGYMEGKGILAGDLTIDRIKGHLGYEPGNIQVKTRTENVQKYYRGDNDCDDVAQPLLASDEEGNDIHIIHKEEAPLPF